MTFCHAKLLLCHQNQNESSPYEGCHTREDHGGGGTHDTEEGRVHGAVGALNGDVVVVERRH